ncbi:hypothetical protein KGA66_06000 [Actinocrinis puniceicyclus]|uniref:Uncharacterized protein n=1 Tax=Actinocrinis puniceicyclus TaxID=977794 RepID=A0A8J7WI42_9ACTN|nr:hypothetical protein [Actinocrinis puniceicyclus]MBS2962591.1 hypothetical protein [Actinocrinis puniceicyclus]
MPSATNGIADHLDPGGLNRRLADLERQVRELRAAKRLEAATVGDGGLNVAAEGSLNVIDEYGNYLMTLGKVTEPISGATQYAFLINRQNPDGTPGQLAFSVYSPLGAPPQTAGLYDAAGNTLWTDDGVAAQGIGRPYLSFPWAPDAASLWPSTAAGAWTNLLVAQVPKQQPRLLVAGAATTPSGVTGQLRLWDYVNGVQIGSTVTVSSAPGGATWAIGPAAIGGNHLDTLQLQLQGQITGGAGALAATVYTSYGLQS